MNEFIMLHGGHHEWGAQSIEPWIPQRPPLQIHHQRLHRHNIRLSRQ